jgi:hypothetical protein
VRATLALPVLGALSVGTYYWFAAPRLAGAYGASSSAGAVLRASLLAVVAWWLTRAIRDHRHATASVASRRA